MTWHWCPYTSRRVSFFPMTKTSCVKRIDGDPFIVVRLSYMLICNGNATSAAMLHYFESWHNIKLGARANFVNESPDKGPKKPPTLLQWHTTKMLEDALMGIGKKHSIQKAREQLLELGVITIHRNPNPNYLFDNTLHYLFHPEVVNKLLDSLPVNSPSAEISQREPESDLPSAEISQTIPNDTSQGSTKEEVPGLAPGAQKKVVKKKSGTPKRPPREFWQAFVDTWHDFHVENCNGEAPSIVGKPLTDLGKLYDLLQLRARRKKAEWTEKYLVDALKFFLAAAITDDWLKKHLTVSNLVEQFDPIFVREAEKTKGKPKPKPFAEEIEYIIGRFNEGELDIRLLTPQIYKKLEERGCVPVGYREQFTGKDPDEQKTNAMMAWLQSITNKTAMP
jgi:hypothetical protein